jgi:GNAT superfamily N-acetyltransferase
MKRRDYVIRRATVADADTIGQHRADMYRDMGQLPEEWRHDLIALTADFLRTAIASGEYVGWLASPADAEGTIVGGGGALVRRRLPRVIEGPHPHIAPGREALIVNVFTERDWRRRGVARAIMNEILGWARAEDFDSIVLHASDEGRTLYQSMGFCATSEMRYEGPRHERT